MERKSVKRKTRGSTKQQKLRGIQLNIVFPFRKFSEAHISQDGKLQSLDTHQGKLLQWMEDNGLNDLWEHMDFDSVPKSTKDPTVKWTPSMGNKANIHLTFEVTERSLLVWKDADWGKLSIYGTRANFSAVETGTKFKLDEHGEVDGETDDSDMHLDEDEQGMSLAIIAAKEAEDVKQQKDQAAEDALKDTAHGSKQEQVKQASKATGSQTPPPHGMEPATPTLETDRRSSTVSSDTKPTQSASSSSKSLTGHNP